MREPTLSQFNEWPEKDKLFWINYETGGYKGSPGTPGFIYYPGYAIRYMHNRKCHIVDAKAIELEEGIAEHRRAAFAINAMCDVN